MQNKDEDDGIEDSPLDMLLVILLEGASKEVVVVTPSSFSFLTSTTLLNKSFDFFSHALHIYYNLYSLDNSVSPSITSTSYRV